MDGRLRVNTGEVRVGLEGALVEQAPCLPVARNVVDADGQLVADRGKATDRP